MVVCAVEPSTCSDVQAYFPLAHTVQGGVGGGVGVQEKEGEQEAGAPAHAVGVRELQEVGTVLVVLIATSLNLLPV